MDNKTIQDNPTISKSQQSKAEKARNGIFGALFFTLLLFGFDFIIYKVVFGYFIGKIVFYSIAFLALICLLAGVSCFFDLKEAKRIEQFEADARNEEKELAEIDPSKKALRAEKMFKMNQKELMRYYDMNLAQTKFLSGLGIMMVIFGVIIVITSLIMYVVLETDRILLFVGNISGVIVNFIGAIFIKMYTKNVAAAVKFHARFAESNNLLLANSIANNIENEDLREQTLSELSKNIILSK